MAVLHLTQADDVRAILGTYLTDGIGHVVELLFIFLLGPLVLSLGEKVFVIVISIDGIEEVLQIVESYGKAHLLLSLRRKAMN